MKDIEITYNKIRYGIMNALYTHFPDIERYGEEIKEGLDPPCFFVKLLNGSQNQELGRRYKRANFFDIHYFSDGDKNEDLNDMAEKLYDKLEIIEIDGIKYRGTGMNHEIVGRVLHFFIEYNFHVYREKPIEPTMQELEQEGWLKP